MMLMGGSLGVFMPCCQLPLLCKALHGVVAKKIFCAHPAERSGRLPIQHAHVCEESIQTRIAGLRPLRCHEHAATRRQPHSKNFVAPVGVGSDPPFGSAKKSAFNMI